MLRYSILILFLGVIFSLHAQDPQFSQIYAIPLYNGPSFAGASGNTRIAVNFRDQWPAVDKEFISYSLGVDHFFDGANSGLGLIAFRDHSGMGLLTTTNVTLQYNYAFNLSRDLSLRPGIQFSFVNRSIDYSRVVFGDQVTIDGTKPTTIEPTLEDNNFYIDLGASVMLNHRRFWFGAFLDHLATPNQSLNSTKSEVPLRLDVFGGLKYVIKSRTIRSQRNNLYILVQYKMQEEFQQGYLGFYWETSRFITGLAYRGLPVERTWEEYLNNDAFIFLLGYRWRQFTIGYSYDFTTSELSSNAAGAHEVSLIWVRSKKKGKKLKVNHVPCPMM